MFGWEYPPLHSGGLGVACQGLVHGLLQNGVKITLVLPIAAKDKQKNLTLCEITDSGDTLPTIQYIESALQPYEGTAEFSRRMQESDDPADSILQELYGPDLGEAVERFTAMSTEATKNVHADVVHCHDWMTYGAGICAARRRRVPLIAHIHATELDRTDFHPNPWIADRERMGLLKADRIIAVSQYTKQLLIQHYGIAPDRITVVHNGHNVHPPKANHTFTRPLLQKRGPLVLFVGRLTTQKNPRQFLETAKVVHDMRPDVQFVMAGDGPMLPELIDYACQLGLCDSVIFTGKATRQEVNTLYSKADCFVMPSLSEPFGLVALEAIAHGAPVVLSRQSGAAEVIDHAFKVDFWDTERFADCILTILREEPLAMQLTSEAPRILQRLNWKNQAGNVLSIYHQLLSSPR